MIQQTGCHKEQTLNKLATFYEKKTCFPIGPATGKQRQIHTRLAYIIASAFVRLSATCFLRILKKTQNASHNAIKHSFTM